MKDAFLECAYYDPEECDNCENCTLNPDQDQISESQQETYDPYYIDLPHRRVDDYAATYGNVASDLGIGDEYLYMPFGSDF